MFFADFISTITQVSKEEIAYIGKQPKLVKLYSW